MLTFHYWSRWFSSHHTYINEIPHWLSRRYLWNKWLSGRDECVLCDLLSQDSAIISWEIVAAVGFEQGSDLWTFTFYWCEIQDLCSAPAVLQSPEKANCLNENTHWSHTSMSEDRLTNVADTISLRAASVPQTDASYPVDYGFCSQFMLTKWFPSSYPPTPDYCSLSPCLLQWLIRLSVIKVHGRIDISACIFNMLSLRKFTDILSSVIWGLMILLGLAEGTLTYVLFCWCLCWTLLTGCWPGG